MGDAFPTHDARVALTSEELAPRSVETFTWNGACYAAVELAYVEGIAYTATTALLVSADDGRTWRRVGTLEGAYGGAAARDRSGALVWSHFQVEGTFSTLYRLDVGGLAPLPGLDAAVRERGGCCFTGVDAVAIVDRDWLAVQVHGLEGGPGAPDVGWFETRDGGGRFTWVGTSLPTGVAPPATAVAPATPACAAAAGGLAQAPR